MADIKWIKLSVGMFSDPKIEFIETLPEADTILLIWVKLLTLAGLSNMGGYIMLTESIPYTQDMLISKINRPISTVRMALETFQRLEMLELNEGAFYLTNWEKHQNIEGMDKVRLQTKNRVAKHRDKKRLLIEEGKKRYSNVTVTESNATDIELELDKEKDSCCYTPMGESKTEDEGIPSSRQDTTPVTPETGADSIQDQISSLEIDYRQILANKYLQRRGKGLEITMADDVVIDEMIKEHVPLQTALDGIDQAFDNFKPKHKRDEVRSLSYCAPVIYSLHATRTAQEDVNSQFQGSRDAVIEPITDGGYSNDDVQAMLAQLRSKREGGD
ncbi:hypothetical protein D1872_198130 [compost metagenome]